MNLTILIVTLNANQLDTNQKTEIIKLGKKFKKEINLLLLTQDILITKTQVER